MKAARLLLPALLPALAACGNLVDHGYFHNPVDDAPDAAICAGCAIHGTCYGEGFKDPSAGCRACRPGVNPYAFSPVDDGTGCGDGQFCVAGSCRAGCLISGKVYPDLATNTEGVCQM
jgi:hypothetical protein